MRALESVAGRDGEDEAGTEGSRSDMISETEHGGGKERPVHRGRRKVKVNEAGAE